jgi:hypothetical protein
MIRKYSIDDEDGASVPSPTHTRAEAPGECCSEPESPRGTLGSKSAILLPDGTNSRIIAVSSQYSKAVPKIGGDRQKAHGRRLASTWSGA